VLGLLRTILTLPKPVVVAARGNVRAGGTGIVGACDVVVVSDTSSFALTEVRLGLAAAVISLTVLPRMDQRAAARYFLSGERFDGTEAARIGLATMAVPAADVDRAAADLLAELTAGSPQGLRATKQLLTRELVRNLDEHGSEMAELSAELFASEEARARMLSFLEKRSS
jgi:enoyl-CoA hydratase